MIAAHLASVRQLFDLPFSPRHLFALCAVNTALDLAPIAILAALLGALDTTRAGAGLGLDDLVLQAGAIALATALVFSKNQILRALNRAIQGVRGRVSTRLLTHRGLPSAAGNLAEACRLVLSEADAAVNMALRPLEKAMAGALTSILIVAYLFAQFGVRAVGGLAAIGLFLLVVFALRQRRVSALGQIRLHNNRERFRTAMDVLRLRDEGIVYGFRARTEQDFDAAAGVFGDSIADGYTAAAMPRYVVEVLALCALALFFVVAFGDGQLLTVKRADAEFFVTLFVALYKLIPAAAQIANSASVVLLGAPAVAELTALPDTVATSEPIPSAPLERAPGTVEVPAFDLHLAGAEQRTQAVTLTGFCTLSGPSGIGKTTWARALLGLGGGTLAVRADERELDVRDPAWLDAVGYVPQHSNFFAGSARENIETCFPRNDARYEAILSCVQLTGLRDRLDAPCADIAQTFSGGELQRISIARCLYKQPGFVVMDEPTASLSEEMTRELLTALQAYVRCPVLIVTHDPAVLAMVDNDLAFATRVLS